MTETRCSICDRLEALHLDMDHPYTVREVNDGPQMCPTCHDQPHPHGGPECPDCGAEGPGSYPGAVDDPAMDRSGMGPTLLETLQMRAMDCLARASAAGGDPSGSRPLARHVDQQQALEILQGLAAWRG